MSYNSCKCTDLQGEITIHGSFTGEGMTIYNEATPQGTHITSLGGYSAAFTPQMTAFLDAVTSRRHLPDSVSQSLMEVLVAKATYKSVQSKKWEDVSIENLSYD